MTEPPERVEPGGTPATDEVWQARRTSFGNQADAYAVGRPSYPREAVEWALPPGAGDVLDLAAGTGRLTAALLGLGLRVTAVEPIDAMRAHIPTGARAVPGTAEALPLDDETVDCVVVGQAFHWFDVSAAMQEIRRVLRPGGTLGLFWNLVDDTDPVTARVAATIGADERLSLLQEDQQPPYADIADMSPPSRRLFRHAETYDVDRLVAYTLSRSQTILLPAAERAALLDAVRTVAPAAGWSMPLVTEAWRGERLR